jgi:hypothetical protein
LIFVDLAEALTTGAAGDSEIQACVTFGESALAGMIANANVNAATPRDFMLNISHPFRTQFIAPKSDELFVPLKLMVPDK